MTECLDRPHEPGRLYPKGIYSGCYYDARTGLPLTGRPRLSSILFWEAWRLFFGPLCDKILRCWIQSAGVPVSPFIGYTYYGAFRVAWRYIRGDSV